MIENREINNWLVIQNQLQKAPIGCLFVCFFLLMLPLLAGAQLTASSEDRKPIDTSAVLQLLEKGQKISQSQPDEALRYFTEALQLSKQGRYPRGVALASAKCGRWYFGNNINKSIAFAREAMDIYEEKGVGTAENIAETHLILAEAYDEHGRKDSSAYFYYLLGRELETDSIKNPTTAIDFYTKLTIFWVNLDYGGAENAQYIETLNRYLQKAKMAAKQIKDTADANSVVFFLQGAYYQGLEMYDSARTYYLDYIRAREKLGKLNKVRKISTLANITETYLIEKRPEEAIAYIKQIKQFGIDPKHSNFLVFYLTFTDLLLAKAYFLEKKYQLAIDLNNVTLQKLTTTGEHLREEVADAYKINAESYEALGDYKTAVKFKNTYELLHDSLAKKDRMDMISSLEIRYQIAEKDKALAEQKLMTGLANSKLRQKNFLIGGICLLVLFGAALFTQWRRKNIHKQRLQQERIDNLQQKIEIERLNATIAGEEKERTRIARELHDGIGGLLSAAKMNFELVDKNGYNELHKTDLRDGINLLQEAAAGLRDTAHNLMPEILLQEGLPRALATYCERMSAKSGTSISFQAVGNPQPLYKTFELPVYRIVQELVHNIKKHAKAKTALVQINFHDDGGLDITVEDDGVGFGGEVWERAGGMGLRSIRQRVEELRGRVEFESRQGSGTSVYIEFEPQKQTGTV
jgi:two-component system NarL family sensor kinase